MVDPSPYALGAWVRLTEHSRKYTTSNVRIPPGTLGRVIRYPFTVLHVTDSGPRLGFAIATCLDNEPWPVWLLNAQDEPPEIALAEPTDDELDRWALFTLTHGGPP